MLKCIIPFPLRPQRLTDGWWKRGGTRVFGSIGIPELVIIMVLSFVWIIPLAVAVWIVVTLRRIRVDQQATHARLDAIERLMRH